MLLFCCTVIVQPLPPAAVHQRPGVVLVETTPSPMTLTLSVTSEPPPVVPPLNVAETDSDVSVPSLIVHWVPVAVSQPTQVTAPPAVEGVAVSTIVESGAA